MRRRRFSLIAITVFALLAASCEPDGGQAQTPPEDPWAVPELPGVERVVPDEPSDPPGPTIPETLVDPVPSVVEDPTVPVGSNPGPAPTTTAPSNNPGPGPVPTTTAPPSPSPTTTAPAPTTPTTAPTTTLAPAPAELTLVYSTTSNGTDTTALHGSILGGAVDVRVEVDGARPDRVEWSIDGVLFRDDDLNAPYNLRYAGRLLPIGGGLDSDQGLAGNWDFGPGSVHAVTATAVWGSRTAATGALFAVAGGSTPPTTTAPPAPTTTTPPPTTTAPPGTTTTTTAPPTTTTTPGPSGVVDPPVGVLGPLTSTAVDPQTVGVGWDGSKYTIPGGFTWNESTDGGYLHFDRGRVLITGNGVSISGAVFEGIASGNNSVVHAASGVGAFTLRHFRLEGGSGSAGVGGSIGRGNGSTISNFSIIGFDGDGMKPPIGSTISDGYIHLIYRPGSALHYDGVQITGRSDITLARLRFRLDGNDNLNAAVFIHGGNNGEVSNNNVVTDIDVIHAPYSWFPMRINSGTVVLRDVIGRGPKSADGKRPAALVLHRNQAGIDWDSIHSEFDGDVPKGRVG